MRLYFEPLFPNQRHGSDPDGLLDPMRDVGFDVTDTYSPYSEGPWVQTEAAFALAERLTGVTVMPKLLLNSEFPAGWVNVSIG